MTDEKKEKRGKKTGKKQKVPKATTGAWWKSVSTLRKKEQKQEESGTATDAGASEELQSEGGVPESSVPSVKAQERASAPGASSDEEDTVKSKSSDEEQSQSRVEEHSMVSGQDQKEAPSPDTPSSDEQEKEKDNQPDRQKNKGGRSRQKQQKKKQAKAKGSTSSDGKSTAKRDSTSTKKEEKRGIIKLLINAEEPEECRIALVENGRLDSYHVTTVVRERTKNNIYKGRIVAVEANLQAAFVDIGTGRNGFLPFNEIHPEYYREDLSDQSRQLISQHQWKKLKIEDVIKKGQEVLVQVVKEVTGNKGANMTTYLSLPGRCLVLMPGSDSAGISRKIVGEDRRSALRDIMSSFSIPEGIGYIIRTASADITKTVLQKDLRYLLRLWKEIKKRGQTMKAPALIYEEQDTVVRFLRDHFSPDISEIIVDTEESLEQVKQFVELLPAKQRKVKLKLHRGAKPIFNQSNVEEQIESIYKPEVPLPSGGSIVINPTEALVAIDVNSGRTSKNGDFEETIFLANMEAAAELARQLRLRDLGGLIVVDFIDMRNKKHIREVEKQVKASMKRDKAKVDISRISRFGLMQISRQKMGAPIEKGSYLPCEHCQGRGVVKSVESQALYILRRIQTGILRKKVHRIECSLPLDVANYLLNKKRKELAELEARHAASIDIISRPEMRPGENQIDYLQA